MFVFCLAVTAQTGKSTEDVVIVYVQPARALTEDGAWLDNWPAFRLTVRKWFSLGQRPRVIRERDCGGCPWLVVYPSRLTPADFDRHSTRPAWSPDGKTIAFRAGRVNPFHMDPPGAIWLLTLATGTLRALTDDGCTTTTTRIGLRWTLALHFASRHQRYGTMGYLASRLAGASGKDHVTSHL